MGGKNGNGFVGCNENVQQPKTRSIAVRVALVLTSTRHICVCMHIHNVLQLQAVTLPHSLFSYHLHLPITSNTDPRTGALAYPLENSTKRTPPQKYQCPGVDRGPRVLP